MKNKLSKINDSDNILENEIEIRWSGGKILVGPFIYQIASWTPDQAEELASYLINAAKEARRSLNVSNN